MNVDRLFALYDRVAEAPDAVGRLRRFVLDLAVRGKLIEQDPADEPASELLKRIAVEKARMVRAGGSRRSRKLPNGEPVRRFGLPASWEWSAIESVAHIEMGQSPRSEHYNRVGNGLAFFQGKADFGPRHPTARYWCTKPTKIAEPGNILLSIRAPVGPTNVADQRCCIGRGLAALRPLEGLSREFMLLALRAFASDLASLGFGSTFVAITKKQLTRYGFPLPPLAEQHRIVAKVDELMGVCDQLEEARTAREDTRDRLTKASLARLAASDIDAPTFRSHARFAVNALPALTARADQVKHLRQTILNLAVRGKLVEQDPSDEPASELLKRIAEGKGKLGVKHEVKPLGVTEAPFRTPGGWHWSRIGELCTKTGSGSTPRGGKSVYKTNGVPFLRSQNVYDDGLRLANVAYIGGDVHARMAGTAVRARDLLLNITGGSMGRCCRVPDGFAEANVSQHVAIIRPAVSEMADYVHKFVLSPYFQAFIFRRQTGAGRGGLPKNRMDRIAVAVPPLAEQQRIVAKVDELMALCDRLEAGLGSAGDTRNRLLESLLQDTLTPPAYEAATAGVVGA